MEIKVKFLRFAVDKTLEVTCLDDKKYIGRVMSYISELDNNEIASEIKIADLNNKLIRIKSIKITKIDILY